MVQSAMSGGGIMPASTHGRPISQIISERWPWRAMLGGMGDEKRPASGSQWQGARRSPTRSGE